MTRLREPSPRFKEQNFRAAASRRLQFFQGIVLCAGIVILGRFVQVQVINSDKWVALAENQHTVSMELHGERGEIAFREGENTYPVAVNREYKMAYAVPKMIEDAVGTAKTLATLLGLDEGALREKLSQRDDPFEVVKRRLSPEEEARLTEAKLKGVLFLPETYRYYPAGELASKVVGFVNVQADGTEVGVYGAEASFEKELRGEDGVLSQERDAAGRWIALTDREHVAARDGESIVLTLDRVIQYEVEKILRESLEAYGADAASALVLEPKTGKLLAMATVPEFNPNDYGKTTDHSLFLNQTVSLPYEPGSIMKPLTMAIGLEEEKVTPGTEYTDTGSVMEAGYTIQNAESKVYGKSSMTRVLEESMNTGVIFVERLVGNTTFRDYLRRLGFGDKTGIRLPAEHAGNLRNLDNPKANLQFYTASFGQGITATPLQIVMAYGALANGGVLMAPQIVDRFIDREGHIRPVAPVEVRRIFGQTTTDAMGQMLRSVVMNGHGKRANVPGYLVGGKTGTAQVAKTDSKGYEDGASIGSFVGYAPIGDPQFVVLVKFDNPTKVEWAESSAAPTFGRIMQFLLDYANVPPTEPLPNS